MPRWMKILAGLFLVLTAAAAGLRWARLTPKTTAFHVPADPIKMEISGPQGRILLEKAGDGWRLREPLDYPADEGSVDALSSSLSDLELGETVTQRSESHGRYDVTESSGIVLKIWGKGMKAPMELVVGKMAPDFTHIYLRVPPAPDVRLAGGIRRSDLDKPVLQWRDKRIFRLGSEEAITTMRFAGKQSSFELSTSSGGWRVDGRPADPQAAESALSEIENLRADGFIDPPGAADLKKWGLESPSRRISLATSSGKTIDLHVGQQDKDAGRFPVRRMGEPVLFWVSGYSLERLPSGPSDLQPSSSK